MKISLTKLYTYLAIFIVFSGAFSLNMCSQLEFRLLYVIIAAVCFLFLPIVRTLLFNKKFLAIFFVISLMSLINIVLGNNTPVNFLKQFVGILLNAMFFYMIFAWNKYEVKMLFGIYYNLALGVAAIGILQQIAYLCKWKAGYDFSWILPHWKYVANLRSPLIRVNSILSEPANFCNVMMPAFFYALCDIGNKKVLFFRKICACMVVCSFLMTFSLTGYVGIIFALMLLALNFQKKKLLIGITGILLVFSGIVYSASAEVRGRCNNIYDLVSGKVSLAEANISTYAFFSNLLVSYNVICEHPLFGYGLGAHVVAYDRFVGSAINESVAVGGGWLNRRDAGSLFARLLSETGIFGIVSFFLFIVVCYIRKREDVSGELWVISNAIVCMFFIKLLRTGHYFFDGFFFFFWTYYFAKKQVLILRNGDMSTDSICAS